MITTQPNPKPCKVCQAMFTPARPLQRVCGPVCARKSVDQQKKAERAEVRGRKEAVKSLRELLAECQVAFNAYIRARDAEKTCIDCGKLFEPQKPGGSMDAGHYLSRGSSPQHRFNEDNVFGQRKNCNRPGGATRDAFRAGVVARIGLERVEAMERDGRVPKWDRAELIELKAEYRRKLRELKDNAKLSGAEGIRS